MCEEKAYTFSPDGNDLRKVMYFYGVEIDSPQICCPFHEDDTPSCHIDYDEGHFYCFGCTASGNAFDFVKLANPTYDGLKQIRTYFKILKSKRTKKLKNIHLRTGKSKKRMTEEEKQHSLDIAYDYFFGIKTTNWRKAEKDLITYMKNRGFTSKSLTAANAKVDPTNRFYPIIFPLFDEKEFKGYVARTTNKRVEKRAKYNYNEGFQRNETLGGQYHAEVVVLCEGYLDKVKLNQFGLKHVAAIFGWKITKNQIEKLKAAGVKYIVSALDNDVKGREGTDYLKNFFEVIEFQFPRNVKDPGDLTQETFNIAFQKTKKLVSERKKSK